MEYDRTAVGPDSLHGCRGTERQKPLQPWKLGHSPTGLSLRNNAGGVECGRDGYGTSGAPKRQVRPTEREQPLPSS
ncbi:hypothetical protein YUYDRAFT_07080 [Streptomyces sp. ScaeMP-e48]|nr:hypothetical protein YUYDRAFT_07080 [Streptomyces sp. ScaeMP-e48]